MPANAVKTPKDERLWARAKEAARKQGRQGDYAYIMGIYQRMKGEKSLTKSYVVPVPYKTHRNPMMRVGPSRQPTPTVPIDPEAQKLQKLAMTPAPKVTEARILEEMDKYPLFSPADVVNGLGMDRATQLEWVDYLTQADSAPNELVYRRVLMSKAQDSPLDPTQKKLLLERSLRYWRGRTQTKLSKALYIGPRGGKWADPQHTIPWKEDKPKKRKKTTAHEQTMSPDAEIKDGWTEEERLEHARVRSMEAVEQGTLMNSKGVWWKRSGSGWTKSKEGKVYTHKEVIEQVDAKDLNKTLNTAKWSETPDAKTRVSNITALLEGIPGVTITHDSRGVTFNVSDDMLGKKQAFDLLVQVKHAVRELHRSGHLPGVRYFHKKVGGHTKWYNYHQTAMGHLAHGGVAGYNVGVKYNAGVDWFDPKTANRSIKDIRSDLVKTKEVQAIQKKQAKLDEQAEAHANYVLREKQRQEDKRKEREDEKGRVDRDLRSEDLPDYTAKRPYGKELRRRQEEELEIEGNTYAIKDEIKRVGGIWDANNRVWLAPDQQTLSAIQNTLSDTKKGSKPKKLVVPKEAKKPTPKLTGKGQGELFPRNKSSLMHDEYTRFFNRVHGNVRFFFEKTTAPGLLKLKARLETTDHPDVNFKALNDATVTGATLEQRQDALKTLKWLHGNLSDNEFNSVVGSSKEVFQGMLDYTESKAVKKSMTHTIPMDLVKAQARGGKYYRRVSKGTDGGYRYYYSAEDYNKTEGAHQSGDDNGREYMSKRVSGVVAKAGGEGCDISQFKGLVKTSGHKSVAEALRSEVKKGNLKYKKGKFYRVEKGDSNE